MTKGAWIGVDLDGTLAELQRVEHWDGSIGRPVVAMVERVKRWLRAGQDVRIVTARVSVVDGITDGPRDVDVQRALIADWCLAHLGQVLPITATKDYHMVELWDDRAVQVITNTGRALVDVINEMADHAVSVSVAIGGTTD